MYDMHKHMNKNISEKSGPSLVKPKGYVNGPVASNKLITVADAAKGDIGSKVFDRIIVTLFDELSAPETLETFRGA